MSKKLKAGGKAPDFELFDQNLNKFRLSDNFGRKHTVLFFYPKDETSGCTKEVCTFRDNMKKFSDKDVQVVGISGDSVESHQRFSTRYRLHYPLLSDAEGQVRKLYGVSKVLGLISGRETFIIDRDGTIAYNFTHLLNAPQHVEEALEAIEEIESRV